MTWHGKSKSTEPLLHASRWSESLKSCSVQALAETCWPSPRLFAGDELSLNNSVRCPIVPAFWPSSSSLLAILALYTWKGDSVRSEWEVVADSAGAAPSPSSASFYRSKDWRLEWEGEGEEAHSVWYASCRGYGARTRGTGWHLPA